MALDSRIPLGVQPLQLPSPLEIYSTVQQIAGQREATEARRLAAEEARERRADAQQKRAQQAALDRALQAAIIIDPKNGRITFDRQTLLKNAPAEVAYKLQRELDDDEVSANTLAKSLLDLEGKKREYRGSIAQTIRAAKYDPNIFRPLMRGAHGFGAIEDALATQYEALEDPATIQPIVDDWFAQGGGKTPELMNVPSRGVVFDPVTREKVFENTQEPAGTPPAVGSFEDYVTQRFGPRPTAEQIAQARTTYQQADDRGADPVLSELRRMQLEAARRAAEQGGNWTPQQTARFNQIVNNYNASPLVKAADRTIVLKQAIADTKADPKNPTHQLNLAYAYIAALDTYQSAVREGELQNLGMLGTRLQQLGVTVNRLTESGAFIPPAVASQIATSAETLAKTIEAGQQQKRREFASRAKVSGVGEMWDQFATSFDTQAAPPAAPGTPTTSPPPTTPGTAPKIGERRTIKGQLAEWDGTGWKAVR